MHFAKIYDDTVGFESAQARYLCNSVVVVYILLVCWEFLGCALYKIVMCDINKKPSIENEKNMADQKSLCLFCALSK